MEGQVGSDLATRRGRDKERVGGGGGEAAEGRGWGGGGRRLETKSIDAREKR
jgi:hypothetical protein